jgi:hypothetical protein
LPTVPPALCPSRPTRQTFAAPCAKPSSLQYARSSCSTVSWALPPNRTHPPRIPYLPCHTRRNSVYC